MQALLATVARYSPLIMLAFLAAMLVQLGMQLGVTAQGTAEVLAAGAWFYAIAAMLAWAVVLVGVFHAARRARALEPRGG